MTADELVAKLNSKLSQWKQTYIPYATWVEAWDLVEQLSDVDFDRANQSSDLLMAKYNKWLAIWREGPDHEFATRVNQGVLL